MLAILSTSIEDAGRLSDALQHYWSAMGIYASVSLFETEDALISAMEKRSYQRVILERAGDLRQVVTQLRRSNPGCKLAVVTDHKDTGKDHETALLCRSLGVEMLLTRRDFEKPLEALSKQLGII